MWTGTGTVVDSKFGTSSPDPGSSGRKEKRRYSSSACYTHYRQQSSLTSGDIPITTSTLPQPRPRERERVFSASSLASNLGELVRGLSNWFSGLPPRITAEYQNWGRGSVVLGAVTDRDVDDAEASEELLARQKSGSTARSGDSGSETSRVSRGGSARRKPPPVLSDSMLEPGSEPGCGTTKQTMSPPPKTRSKPYDPSSTPPTSPSAPKPDMPPSHSTLAPYTSSTSSPPRSTHLPTLYTPHTLLRIKIQKHSPPNGTMDPIGVLVSAKVAWF